MPYKSSSDSYNLEKRLLLCRKSPPPSTNHMEKSEKIPYFIDEVRERDRILHKYEAARNELPKYSCSSSRSHCKSSNRDYAPIRRTNRRTSISTNRHSVDISKKSRENSKSHHTTKRNSKYHQYRSESRKRSGRRGYNSRAYSRSRTRSPGPACLIRPRTENNHSERREYRQVDHYETLNADLGERNLPQPQIITIPVPVSADFLSYSYSTWPTQTQWATQLTQPSPYPSILTPAAIPPMRPPFLPYGIAHSPIHYSGFGFGVPSQYGARLWRPSFRGRNA